MIGTPKEAEQREEPCNKMVCIVGTKDVGRSE